jgi:hypothetical protein
MNKLLSLVFVIGILCAPSAQAMPIAPLSQPQGTQTIQVGYGYACSLAILGGPVAPCAPVHVYGGYYPYYSPCGHCGYYGGHYAGRRTAHYPYVRHLPGDVVFVDKGVCGFGSYLSCSHGTCWRYCY